MTEEQQIEEDVMPDISMNIMFAGSGEAEVLTVPMNAPKSFTMLYRMDGVSGEHALVIGGVPDGPDITGEEQAEILRDFMRMLLEYVSDEGLERELVQRREEIVRMLEEEEE